MRESAEGLVARIWPGWTFDVDTDLIGEGAYGRVYKASRDAGGFVSRAAIKVIEIPKDDEEVTALRDMGMDEVSVRSYFEETAQSLMGEVAVMERLKSSPHVVHIEDFQLVPRENGLGWIVLIRMELLESLAAFHRRKGIPTPQEAARIGVEMCEALTACHAIGVIHRDVKPENVFRGPYGDYKLGDFGIAKRLDDATRSTKSFAGTKPFMAPEVESGHYGPSVDTYSLGIMLYRWLNGSRPPFLPASGPITQNDLQRASMRRLSGELPPLPAGEGVDPELARIVGRAIEPDPARRWGSAAEMGEALRTWLRRSAKSEPKPEPKPEPKLEPKPEPELPTYEPTRVETENRSVTVRLWVAPEVGEQSLDSDQGDAPRNAGHKTAAVVPRPPVKKAEPREEPRVKRMPEVGSDAGKLAPEAEEAPRRRDVSLLDVAVTVAAVVAVVLVACLLAALLDDMAVKLSAG